jgi:hypothetical protein
LKNDVNVPSKRKKPKKLFFVGVLKVHDEKIHWAEAWIRESGSGSIPKYHGSATLMETKTFINLIFLSQ